MLCIENTNLQQTAVKRQKVLTLIEGRKFKLNIFFTSFHVLIRNLIKAFLSSNTKWFVFSKAALPGKMREEKENLKLKFKKCRRKQMCIV